MAEAAEAAEAAVEAAEAEAEAAEEAAAPLTVAGLLTATAAASASAAMPRHYRRRGPRGCCWRCRCRRRQQGRRRRRRRRQQGRRQGRLSGCCCRSVTREHGCKSCVVLHQHFHLRLLLSTSQWQTVRRPIVRQDCATYVEEARCVHLEEPGADGCLLGPGA